MEEMQQIWIKSCTAADYMIIVLDKAADERRRSTHRDTGKGPGGWRGRECEKGKDAERGSGEERKEENLAQRQREGAGRLEGERM